MTNGIRIVRVIFPFFFFLLFVLVFRSLHAGDSAVRSRGPACGASFVLLFAYAHSHSDHARVINVRVRYIHFPLCSGDGDEYLAGRKK